MVSSALLAGPVSPAIGRVRPALAVGALLALSGPASGAPTRTASVAAAATTTTTSTSGPAGPRVAGALGEAGTQPFSVSADRLTASATADRYVAEGHVVVRRPGAVLYADRVVFDRRTGLARAEGHVVAVEGASVLTCDRVEMRVPELMGDAAEVELRLKAARTVPGLAGRPRGALGEAGKDELIVHAERLERTGPRAVAVQGASFTACDCGAGNRPSWRIRSHRASVDLDSGAWLTLPVFYVLDVPVMVLPVFYVPLGERRSGLLTPTFAFNSAFGFRVGLPVYVVLGRSWDLTLEPFYLSERGGGGALELRYAPSAHTRGTWRTSVVVDVGELEGEDWSKTGDPIVRFALAGTHDTRWRQSRLRADVNLFGDPTYQADFADAFLTRQAEFSRSRLTFGQDYGADLRLQTGVQLLQDLRAGAYPLAPDGLREVSLVSGQVWTDETTGDLLGPGTIRYRFADLYLDAPPAALWSPSIGPLLGGARLAVTAYSAPRPEAPRFVRADFRPEVAWPLGLPGGLVLEPSVAARFTAWAGRADSVAVSGSRATAVLRTDLHLDLVRDFGSVTHRIRPSVAHVLVPDVVRFGDDVFDTRDEVDLLRVVHQVRAQVETELVDSVRGTRWLGLNAWVGRDLGFGGLAEAGTSELVLDGDALWNRPGVPVVLGLAGRLVLALQDPTPTEVRATARIADRRGDSLSVTYARFDDVFPRYTLRGPEELVPSGAVDPAQYVPFEDFSTLDPVARQAVAPWSAYTGLTVRAQARPFRPLTLAFDITFAFDDADVIERVYGPQGTTSVVRSTRTSVRWDSPCDCWSGVLSVATARDREGIQLDFGVDLARLGSAGL